MITSKIMDNLRTVTAYKKLRSMRCVTLATLQIRNCGCSLASRMRAQRRRKYLKLTDAQTNGTHDVDDKLVAP